MQGAALTDAPVVQPPPQTTSAVDVPATTTTPPPETTSGPVTVPTPIQQTCPTPGTYTFPATTVVVTETITTCAPSPTKVPSGTHTLGGVTTIVETATTVTCPVATTRTENGVVTSIVETTTFVCPTPGTYTIGPITTTVTESENEVNVPTVTTYNPGTYTAPAIVTTITETNVVVTCPFTSETPAPTTTSVVEPPQSPSPPQEDPTPSEEPQPSEDPKPSEAPKPSDSPKPPSLGGSGKLWAMTYTPFRPDGTCKTAGEVAEDVAAIASAGFNTLRVYSTDCDTLPNVGAAARANGLRLIVGIFIGQVGCDNGNPDVTEQIEALKKWKQWDIVDLCVVANEAMFNGFCSPSQLRDLIVRTKTELASVGYNGPFTTTDVVGAWIENDVSGVCDVIDVVATNAHPYFNSQTTPSMAGKFVASQLAIVEKVCNKPGYVMETGWPTAGKCNGVACAGEQEQRTAIESIMNELGSKVVFFSFRDDPWKQPGECNCEQHWGSAKVFGF